MRSFDEALWTSLENMRIAPAGAALTFEARLAREQGWSRFYTAKVMQEYRRFLYMAAKTPGQVTPSHAVDEAWHLHLSYTRHYWGELCPNILGRPLHHNPTEGGPAERARFRDQYACTLAFYEATFGAIPPASVWPSVDDRFAPEPPRTPWWRIAAVAASSTLFVACTALQAEAGRGSGQAQWGVLILILAFVAVVAILAAKSGSRKGDGSCGGGCGGLAAVTAVEATAGVAGVGAAAAAEPCLLSL